MTLTDDDVALLQGARVVWPGMSKVGELSNGAEVGMGPSAFDRCVRLALIWRRTLDGQKVFTESDITDEMRADRDALSWAVALLIAQGEDPNLTPPPD